MACCLTAPSHYLSRCWLVVKCVLWHSPASNSLTSANEFYSLHVFGHNTLKFTTTPHRAKIIDDCNTAIYVLRNMPKVTQLSQLKWMFMVWCPSGARTSATGIMTWAGRRISAVPRCIECTVTCCIIMIIIVSVWTSPEILPTKTKERTPILNHISDKNTFFYFSLSFFFFFFFRGMNIATMWLIYKNMATRK